MPTGNRYRINAIWTGVQIMKVIASAKGPLGPTEIATELDIDTNKAYRTCETLSEAGMLEETGGRYTLGTFCMLIWAKSKAKLESQREQIDKLLAVIKED